ncbi:MAG TPA: SWIM zinc finger family protein [Ilumatobacter sp.]
MSRPRKPYGPKLPGRLQGTMIKVLAAEMSDQGRLARGRQYWADDAVVDIVVGHGAVTAEVQGGRAEPYVVTLETAAGSGVPARRDVWVQCTCPDDTGTGADACKHAVAALFALSDEVTLEPLLVERWRDSRRAARRPDAAPASAADRTGEVIELRRRDERGADKISVMLQAPSGAPPPTFPDASPLVHPVLRDRLVHEVLDDCLDHLAIRWE